MCDFLTGGFMTVEIFKAWYDSVYIGDGDTVTSMPQSVYDAGYSDYMTGYTLAYGAYLEGVKFAESQKYKTLIEQAKRISELEYSLSISMCVHDDAENMTGAQRDALAMKTLGATT